VIFSYLLPPIILAAGYNMKRKFFFNNVSWVALFGFAGTVVNFFLASSGFYVVNNIVKTAIGDTSTEWTWTYLQGMKMAAALVASDAIAPLTLIDADKYPTLFSIIFGEGVSNDAVALILCETVTDLENTGNSRENSSLTNQLSRT
jgi:NhaP-type Na+/H+ or K+/H+ antiporter